MSISVKMYQTADDIKYTRIIEATSPVNREYCSLYNIEFNLFVGIKRGYHPWQACFNRIVYLKEQMDSGFDGWIFYLDADAYVQDQNVDVRSVIADAQGDIIFAPGGLTGERWDVNDGVFIINLSAPASRLLIDAWYANLMTTSDSDLEAAREWHTSPVPSDQPRLHQILKDNPDITREVVIVPRELLNDENATFVRQVLRANAETFEKRVERIQEGVKSIVRFSRSVDVQITTNGNLNTSTQYGNDYASEFRRVLSTYAKDAKSFLEWGAGYTTKMILEHIGDREADIFLTIDENAEYLRDVTSDYSSLKYFFARAVALTGPCVDDRDKGLNYSTFPLSIRRKFDFIFIDGRRRLECSLTAALVANPNSIIVMHDYRRARYQPAKALFKIIEDGSQFRVMVPRSSLFNAIDEVQPLILESINGN